MIVAHGTPSAPEAGEEWVHALAARVRLLLPGIDIHGATLAAAGSLECAMAGTGERPPIVYPMFMADGWFVRKELPRRLAGLHVARPTITAPFGHHPRLPALCLATVAAVALDQGWRLSETTVILAAHGSPSDARPREVAEAVAAHLRATAPFREVRCGFIDEKPLLADVADAPPPAICLPFFAAMGGHVTNDIPEALASARFRGEILDPIGVREEALPLIAETISDEIVCNANIPRVACDHRSAV